MFVVALLLFRQMAVIQCKQYDRKQDVPIVIYTDFESILESCESSVYQTTNMRNLNHHVSVAFGYCFVCFADPSYNNCMCHVVGLTVCLNIRNENSFLLFFRMFAKFTRSFKKIYQLFLAKMVQLILGMQAFATFAANTYLVIN